MAGLLNAILDGQGMTAKFNSVDITELKQVEFSLGGEREVNDLTTANNEEYECSLLSDLKKVSDVVITKLSAAGDATIVGTNAQLVIGFKEGKTTAKTVTYWAQLKAIKPTKLIVKAKEGIAHDLVFHVTNLNATVVVTGPVIAASTP